MGLESILKSCSLIISLALVIIGTPLRADTGPIRIPIQFEVTSDHRLTIANVPELELIIVERAKILFPAPKYSKEQAIRLTRFFATNYLKELRRLIGRWAPLGEWRVGDQKKIYTLFREGTAPPRAAGTSIPLADWIGQVLPVDTPVALNFVHWKPVFDYEEADAQAETEFIFALQELVAGMGAKFSADKLAEDFAPRNGKPRDRTSFEIPIPQAIDEVQVNREPFFDHSGEISRLERELKKSVSNVKLQWGEDLAVQRMKLVLFGRGFWLDQTPLNPGEWRTAPWQQIEDSVAKIGVPHLVAVRYEHPPEKKSWNEIRSFARKILERALPNVLCEEELQVVGQAFDLRERYPNAGKIPVDEETLGKVVVFSRNSKVTSIQLFWLREYLLKNRPQVIPDKSGALGIPLTQDRADRLLEAIRLQKSDNQQPLRAGIVPTANEAGLARSLSAKWKDFRFGAVDLIVTVNRKSPSDAAPTDSEKPGEEKSTDEKVTAEPSFKSWLHAQGVRLQVGVTKDSSVPLQSEVRLSTANTAMFGKFELGLTYSLKLSGELEWNPPAERFSEAQKAVLPSAVRIFHATEPRRILEASDFELKSDGFAVDKAWQLQRPIYGRQTAWIDTSIELAKVKNVASSISPTLNQVILRTSFVSSAKSNPWDQREHLGFRIGVAGGGRGDRSLELWAMAEAQWQKGTVLGDGRWAHEVQVGAKFAMGNSPLDMLPYVGGPEGVRGVKTFAVPARTVVLVRNELWTPMPFIGRDYSRDQSLFNAVYNTVRPAIFLDAGWADGIREPVSARSWMLAPGFGVRFLLGPIVLNFDYAYGLMRPTSLGGHRFVVGASSRF
jgi:hypothetical protein